MKFDKKQLERWIDTELNCLRYYGNRDDCKSLTITYNLYDEVKSIGYTKRPLRLDRRCAPVSITCDTDITNSTKIEDLYVIYTWDRSNSFTPVEIFIKLFPERKMEIFDILQSQESNPNTTIFI